MTSKQKDVTALMRKEFAAAKSCWAALLALQIAALVVAVLAAVTPNRLALVVAASGLLLPALTSFVRSRAGAYQGRGEEIRKAVMLADGWGIKVDLGVLLVRVAQSTLLPGMDTPPIGSYFNSKKPAGPLRVAHLLQQSAFFTARHAGTAFWLAAFVAVGAGVGGIAIIWAAAIGATPFAHATDVGAALLTFAAGGEFLSIALAFHRLAAVAAVTLSSCEALMRSGTPEQAELSLLTSAYDCSVAQAPPIPSSLYRLQRERLERAWAAYNREIESK